MSNTNINNLLNLLNETTTKCNKLTVLIESNDEQYSNIIQKHIFGLQNFLINSLSISNPSYMTADTVDLIKKVRNISITEDHKVMTYPNIHNKKKYDIKAGVMIGYVLNKLDHNLKNNIDIDSKKILNEAIAYTFKKLTGNDVGKELDISEFRERYRLYALGGSRRVLILPNVYTLTQLATKSPYIINYIDDHLLYKHVSSLKSYANELNHHFSDLVDKDPSMKNKLNKYINCVELAIKYVSRMYRDIRTVMFELDVEYKRIFREIISIEKSLNNSINESIQFDDVILNLNNVYKQVDEFNNYVLNESIENQKSKESLLKSLKESLINTNKYFLNTNITKLNEREQTRNKLKNNMCLISKLNQEFCNEHPVRTLSTINQVLTSNIKNVLSQQMIDRGNDISELPESKELVKLILKDVDLLKNCYSEPEYDSWLFSTINNINKVLIDNHNNEYITLDVESLANNLILIPNILEEINDSMLLLYKSISDKITNITERIKNGDYNIKNEIMKIVNYYCVYNEILNCIYKDIESIGMETVSIISKILNNEVI